MNKMFSSALLMALLASVASASASDMGRPMPVPPPYILPLYNWSGFYVGANLGGAWNDTTLNDSFTGFQIGNSSSGVIGGGQLGYNWQSGPLMLGAEWMFDGTSLSASRTVGFLQGAANTNWLTTFAGRLGWVSNNWLFYGKGGGGWADASVTLTNLANGTQLSNSHTSAGWLAGAGIEYGITPNWTLKFEYDYLGMNTWTANSTLFAPNADRVSVKPNIQTFIVGANFKF
jgi:opacity protein-like surface antigen